jgi:hypothetical protein
MTAKHVVEGHWRDFEINPLIEGESTGSFSLQCFQVLEEGVSAALWDVTRLWLSPHTDIAYLRLQPASKTAQSHRWRRVRLNLLPPWVGERVSAFGYAASSVTLDESRGALLWKDSPSTSSGKVIEIHHKFRDMGFMKFPCFRVNARDPPAPLERPAPSLQLFLQRQLGLLHRLLLWGLLARLGPLVQWHR